MISNSRVCSKQQSSFSNKSIIFYSKLWKRVENRGRYQKKKKVTEFAERMRQVQEEAGAVLRKV